VKDVDGVINAEKAKTTGTAGDAVAALDDKMK
jgi:hypothetical protein